MVTWCEGIASGWFPSLTEYHPTTPQRSARSCLLVSPEKNHRWWEKRKKKKGLPRVWLRGPCSKPSRSQREGSVDDVVQLPAATTQRPHKVPPLLGWLDEDMVTWCEGSVDDVVQLPAATTQRPHKDQLVRKVRTWYECIAAVSRATMTKTCVKSTPNDKNVREICANPWKVVGVYTFWPIRLVPNLTPAYYLESRIILFS